MKWRAGYVVSMEGNVVSRIWVGSFYGLNLLSSKHHYLKPCSLSTPSAPGWQYAETIEPLISDHEATLRDYQIWVTFNCWLSHTMVCLLSGNCTYWKHMARITQPLGTRPFPPLSPTSLHNPQTHLVHTFPQWCCQGNRFSLYVPLLSLILHNQQPLLHRLHARNHIVHGSKYTCGNMIYTQLYKHLNELKQFTKRKCACWKRMSTIT